MATPKEQLLVFEKIENSKINQMFNLVDESIIVTQIKKEKILKIIGEGFSNLEIYYINNALFNFVNIKTEEIILKIIENSELSNDKKNILKENFQAIKKSLSQDKISLLKSMSFLEDFGHPHVHTMGVYTEFRPLSKNGKIVKIIPSLIIKGSVHNPDNDKNILINFQMTLKEFEKIITEFQNDASVMKKEIAEFKEKFGDDIIDE